MALSVEALVFIVFGRSCSEGCRFDSNTTDRAVFFRFNYRPIMWSPCCATWNKGVRLLSVLKLWPIVETSVVFENDGKTVRQTIDTIQLTTWARYATWFTPFKEKGTIIPSASKVSCSKSGAGLYDITKTGPRWGV